MKSKSIRWFVAALLLAAGLGTLKAKTIAWDGGPSGTGTNWNEAVNWSGDVKPGANDTADFRYAVGATDKTYLLDAPQSIGTIAFPTYGNQPNVTIGTAADAAAGNALTIMEGVFRGDNVGNWQTLRADIVLGTNTTWEVRPGYNSGVTVSGGISGTGFGLTKWASGTLRLQGTNTYTGNTVVRTGTLQLDFNNGTAPLANIVNPDSPLRMEGGYLHLLRKAAASRSQTFNGVTAAIGATTARIESNWDANARMTFDAFARMPGATMNLRQPSGNTTIKASNGFTTTQANDATGILGAFLTVSPENSDTPADWAANNDVNIVAYSGYTTPVGAPAVIADGASSNVQIDGTSTGDVTLESSSSAINTLKFADTSSRKLDLTNGTLRLGSGLGAILVPSGRGVFAITNGTLTSAAASGEIVFINSSEVVNSAALTDTGNGAVTLTKSGSGKLTFLTAPSHTGGTFVNAGSLYLPNIVNPLKPATDLTVNGGTLNFGGATQTNSANFVIRSGTIQSGTIVKTETDYKAEGGTVSAILGGSVGLVKTSPEKLTLSGNNTYTGTTIVEEGILSAGAGAIDGNLVVGKPEGGYPASFSGSDASTISDSKNVTVYPNGTFSANSSDNYNNLVIVGGAGGNGYINGTIYMTGGRVTGSLYGGHKNYTIYASSETAIFEAYNSMNTYGNHTFSIADGAAPIDLKITGGIAGSTTGYTISKTGAGTMQITSSSSVDFKTFTLSAGRLLADNASGSALGKMPITVAGGATLGGTGFIGGVSGYTSANVSVAGASGNPAVVAPGTVDPVTGDHVIGTLTVGSGAQANNVTFGANSALKIGFDTNGNCDKLAVNGTLSLDAATDKLVLDIADYDALKAGTYTLATFTALATPGTVFDVVEKPTSGTLQYTATSIEYVVHPKTTVLVVK